MNTRQAHQIRAGINAARLAHQHPELRPVLLIPLTTLGKCALEEWEEKQPLRETRAWSRRLTQEARKRVEEFRIRSQFNAIIEYNRETNA